MSTRVRCDRAALYFRTVAYLVLTSSGYGLEQRSLRIRQFAFSHQVLRILDLPVYRSDALRLNRPFCASLVEVP